MLLPEYGGQTVKLNDTECVAAAPARARRQHAHSQLTPHAACALRRYMLFRDEEILGVLKDD